MSEALSRQTLLDPFQTPTTTPMHLIGDTLLLVAWDIELRNSKNDYSSGLRGDTSLVQVVNRPGSFYVSEYQRVNALVCFRNFFLLCAACIPTSPRSLTSLSNPSLCRACVYVHRKRRNAIWQEKCGTVPDHSALLASRMKIQ